MTPLPRAVALLMMTAVATPAFAQSVEPTEPRLTHSIGLEPDGVFFDEISDVTVLEDGDLVVAEFRAGQARVIDPNAGDARLLGGRGGGPGEFGYPRDLGRLGPSVWVWDPGQNRITLFGAAGEVEETFTVPPLWGEVAVLAGGQIVGRRRPPPPADSQPWLVLLDPNGTSVRDSVRLERTERWFRMSSGQLDIKQIQLWSDHTLWTPSPLGDGFALVHRPTSGPAVVRISWYDPEGRLAREVDVEYEPIPIGRRQVRAFAEAMSATILDASPGFRTRIDPRAFSASEVERNLYVPDRFPPVTAATLSATGDVYLRAQLMDDGPRAVYWVVTADGLQSMLSLPKDFRLMHAGARGLWGVRTDDLDREFLVRYALPEIR